MTLKWKVIVEGKKQANSPLAQLFLNCDPCRGCGVEKAAIPYWSGACGGKLDCFETNLDGFWFDINPKLMICG